MTIISGLGQHYSCGKVGRETLLALNRLGYNVAGLNQCVDAREINNAWRDRYHAMLRHLLTDKVQGIPWVMGASTVNCRDYFPTSEKKSGSPTLVRQLLAKFEWVAPSAIDDQTFIVVTFGCLQQRKGMSELIAAWRQAFAHTDNAVLLLHQGFAPWREDLAPSAFGDVRDLAGVAWCKQNLTTAEQRALLSGGDVGVFPSYLEGFGLCPLETLACGTPVILPAHSGMMEYADDEACYLLHDFRVEPYDHPSICPDMAVEWYRPSVDELAGMLRRAFVDRVELAAKAAAARPLALRHPWETGATLLAQAAGIEPIHMPTDGKTTICTLARDNCAMIGGARALSVANSRSTRLGHAHLRPAPRWRSPASAAPTPRPRRSAAPARFSSLAVHHN